LKSIAFSCKTLKRKGFCDPKGVFGIDHKRIFCAKTCEVCLKSKDGGGSPGSDGKLPGGDVPGGGKQSKLKIRKIL
jgi:hypothetical protein